MKWFNQSRRIVQLECDLDFQTKRAEWLDEQLTLALKDKAKAQSRADKAYDRLEKVMLRYGDMASVLMGKKPHFVADAEPVKEEEPDTPNEEEMSRYRHTAEQMREQMLEQCETETEKERVPSVETLVEKIQANPEYVYV